MYHPCKRGNQLTTPKPIPAVTNISNKESGIIKKQQVFFDKKGGRKFNSLPHLFPFTD
ncbi:hypothetical protein SGODD07_01109 [Streptococcus gordonii]|uniref:Uncharacterized protein n=1 Tax=Streptococcus gordonii TaxID=1302 RepID=A0A139N6K3_STRGN|nr:hypothetical protein SGODD07_01109 [Streptococcus gordonii]